jgi:hypothetical protein
MVDFPKMSLASIKQRARTVLAARRTRRIAVIGAAAVAVYALLGFFAAPALIRHIGQKQISAQLDRPATIARVALNPFTLRFEIDGLHIGEPSKTSGSVNFIDIRRVLVRPSWSSLFHLAPIIKEVQIDSPDVTLVRYDAEHFNFSDLIAKFSTPSPNAAPGKRARFAVSNIHIENGQIHFDDRLLHAQHLVDHFSLGVPFVATLASATDIFVTPSLQAQIDGSPVSIVGRTKPFSQSKESDIQLKLNGLDLPRLASYLPPSVPVLIKSGQLSTDLIVGFSIAGDAPTIHISGTVDLARFTATDRTDAPLANFESLHIAIANAEPLRSIYALDEVRLDGPNISLSRDPKGMLNIQKLLAGSAGAIAEKPAQITSSASAAGTKAGTNTTTLSSASASSLASSGVNSASQSASAPAPTTPLDLSIKHISINGGTVAFDDAAVAPPTALGLSKLTASVDSFSTQSKTPALYSLKTAIDHGGRLDVSGDLSLAAKQTHLKLALDSFDLPPLQPYLPNTIAARLTSGKLSAALPVDVAWSSPQPAMRVGAGSVTLRALTLTPAGDIAPVSLSSAEATIRDIDVNAHNAALDSIHISGLSLAARRLKDGSIDLSTIASRSVPASERADVSRADTAESGAQNAAPAWHYQIGKISLDNASADFTDQTTARPVKLHVSPLQIVGAGDQRRSAQTARGRWATDVERDRHPGGSRVYHA